VNSNPLKFSQLSSDPYLFSKFRENLSSAIVLTNKHKHGGVARRPIVGEFYSLHSRGIPKTEDYHSETQYSILVWRKLVVP